MATTLGKRKSREDQHPEKGGHGSTLFVSNLPYDATSTDLKTAFSDLAPIRSAFVVLEHGTGVSKGVGYVSFAIREDAQTAFDTITSDGMTMNGRKLRVEWAGVKPKDRPTKDRPSKPKPKADSVKKEEEEEIKLPALESKDPFAIRTILISGLPSTIDLKALWKKVRKLDGAENVVWPGKTTSGDEDPTTASVLFSTSKNAQDAVNKLHAHVFKGSLLSVTLKKRLENLVQGSKKKQVKAALPSRASRLIVRNLPFDFTEQDLRAIFLPYGPIHSINMPVTNVDDTERDDCEEGAKSSASNRSKGFAFVWMLSRKDAETALEECNGMKVKAGMAHTIVSDKQKRKKDRREEKKHAQCGKEEGVEGASEATGSSSKERMIVVDWALSKDRWEEAKSKLEQGGEGEGSEGDVEMKDSGSESDGDDKDENEDEEDSEDGDEHMGDRKSVV